MMAGNRSSSVTTYRPPFLFTNGHVQTVFPTLFRRVPGVLYRRERIDTSDGDFLDLDWVAASPPASRLAVLCHGLEGSSDSVYIRGMARAFAEDGWDALPWNYRGCSGEVNRRPRSYHAGATDDLETVISHAMTLGYRAIALVGFSLGGNLVLKYLGERGAESPVCTAIVFSVPCDLAACSVRLAHPANAIYQHRFMTQLRAKIRRFAARFPGTVDLAGLEEMRTFHEFDDRFTARLNGFADAYDYWTRCSSKRFLAGIRVPTLIVNALDDPFLPAGCYPVGEAAANPAITFETPRHGGHVGFVRFAEDRLYWSELRALAFAKKVACLQLQKEPA